MMPAPKKYYRLLNNILNRFLLSLNLFVISSAAFAQDFFVHAGLNANNITGTGYSTFQKPGLYAAAGWVSTIEGLKEGKVYYGLGFSQKGAKKSPNPSQNDFVAYNIRLNYIEAPLLFEFKMKSIKALAGLTAGCLVNKKEKDLNGITLLQNSSYRLFDFSACGGFAVYVGEHFNFNLKASYSIFPVVNTLPGTLAFSRGPRNVGFTLGLTYIFSRKPPKSLKKTVIFNFC